VWLFFSSLIAEALLMTRWTLVFVAVGALACGSSKNEGTGGTGGGATGGATAGTGGGAGGTGDAAAGSGGGTDAAAGSGGGADAGGGVSGSDSGAPGDGGTSASTMIGAAAGGTVSAGGATLSIPAGALAADTTITVQAAPPSDGLPDKASIVGLVYDLGPNGTTFTKPALLTLPLAMTPPAGQGAVISWLDTQTKAWIDLPTTSGAGTVSGQTTHFTQFTVRLVAGAAACAFGGGCAGSLAGAWSITDVCIGKAAKDVNDICTAADTDSYVIGTGGSGTFTVTGDKYTVDLKANVRAVYSAACLTRTNIQSCPAVEEALVKFLMVMPTCTGTAATGCDCTFVSMVKETGTVSASNQLTREMDPAGETQVGEACAKDGNLQIRSTKTKTAAGKTPVVTVTVLSGKKM
jgi:hypothetical protein